MIINFNEMEAIKHERFKGGTKHLEVKIFTDENNKILSGRLVPGASIGIHTHESNSETIFIVEGKGQVLFQGELEAVEVGMCHYCPQGAEHSLINNSEEDLVFYAVVPEHEGTGL